LVETFIGSRTIPAGGEIRSQKPEKQEQVMREDWPMRTSIVAGCIVLSACANNEQAARPLSSNSSVTQPAPMSRVAEGPGSPRGTPALPFSMVPGSPQDFQINVGDRVLFSFDSASLDGQARQTLAKEAIWLKRFPGVHVTLQGNCDERGTREYNLALGARRAESVKEYLTVSGVNPARLTTISFGKEQPVCADSNEACWSKNRRTVSLITDSVPPNIAMR
jgi:peptidoglycan-associated lipoprotein